PHAISTAGPSKGPAPPATSSVGQSPTSLTRFQQRDPRRVPHPPRRARSGNARPPSRDFNSGTLEGSRTPRAHLRRAKPDLPHAINTLPACSPCRRASPPQPFDAAGLAAAGAAAALGADAAGAAAALGGDAAGAGAPAALGADAAGVGAPAALGGDAA